ncbi:MAG: helix-turn-helix domain-containing protein [Casimicrobiaceae bacterium]
MTTIVDADALLGALVNLLADAVAERIAASLQASAPAPDEWLLAYEAAAVAKLSTARLETLRRIGGGPPFERTGRRVRYRRADVDAWLRGRSTGSVR